MNKLHTELLLRGVERARASVDSRQDRRLVEIAAEILAEGADRIGISHAGFALTSLPHKETREPVWRREGHNILLLVESGRDRQGVAVGIPFGSKARMILLYLQTQAIRTQSREVELGPSMRAWMGALGIGTTGGMTYKLVIRQAQRIAACRLTFFTRRNDLELRQNGAFVDSEVSLFGGGADGRQGLLWQEKVTLNEHFYRSLQAHPVPIREAALRCIGSSSLAIDVYIWLAYRLHSLNRPIAISWPAIHAQFGAGFKLMRQVKPTFVEALRLALAVYPEAKVEVDPVAGLTLYPSRPPVSPLTRLG
jgi:hypothetical protein